MLAVIHLLFSFDFGINVLLNRVHCRIHGRTELLSICSEVYIKAPGFCNLVLCCIEHFCCHHCRIGSRRAHHWASRENSLSQWLPIGFAYLLFSAGPETGRHFTVFLVTLVWFVDTHLNISVSVTSETSPSFLFLTIHLPDIFTNHYKRTVCSICRILLTSTRSQICWLQKHISFRAVIWNPSKQLSSHWFLLFTNVIKDYLNQQTVFSWVFCKLFHN